MDSYHKYWRDYIRPLVMLRDNFTCAVCGRKSFSNHVHHADNNRSNNAPENLITVCPKCHSLFTFTRLKSCQILRTLTDEAQIAAERLLIFALEHMPSDTKPA